MSYPFPNVVDVWDEAQQSPSGAAEFPFLADRTTAWDELLADREGRNADTSRLGIGFDSHDGVIGLDTRREQRQADRNAWDAREAARDTRNLGDHYNEFAEGIGGFFGRLAGGAASGAASAVGKSIPWGLIVIAVVALMVLK